MVEPRLWKILYRQNGFIFPKFGVKIKRYLKPPPRLYQYNCPLRTHESVEHIIRSSYEVHYCRSENPTQVLNEWWNRLDRCALENCVYWEETTPCLAGRWMMIHNASATFKTLKSHKNKWVHSEMASHTPYSKPVHAASNQGFGHQFHRKFTHPGKSLISRMSSQSKVKTKCSSNLWYIILV